MNTHFVRQVPLLLIFTLGIDGSQAEPSGLLDSFMLFDSQPRVEELRERRAAVEKHQQKIIELESKSGAYGESLSEAFLELANIESEYDAEDALESLEKGLHITRVNYGLFSLEQNPFLEELIRIHITTNEWQEVDSWLKHYYTLQLHSLPVENSEWVEIYRAMARWETFKRENNIFLPVEDFFAVNLPPFMQSYLKLSAEDMADLSLSRGKINNINFIKKKIYFENTLHYLKLAAQQLDALHADSETKLKLNHLRKKLYFEKWSFVPPRANIGSISNWWGQLLRFSYRDGLSFFQEEFESINSNPGSTPLEKAQAALELADWHLKYRKPGDAREIYKQCYEDLLAVDMAPEEIEKAMNGQDLTRISGGFSWIDLSKDKKNIDAPFLDVSFSLSSAGRPYKIKIEDYQKNDMRQESRNLRNMLQALRFRPKLQEGKTIRSHNHEYRVYMMSLAQLSEKPSKRFD